MNMEINSEVGKLHPEIDELLTKTQINTGLPVSNDALLNYIFRLERRMVYLQLKNEELLLAKENSANIATIK